MVVPLCERICETETLFIPNLFESGTSRQAEADKLNMLQITIFDTLPSCSDSQPTFTGKPQTEYMKAEYDDTICFSHVLRIFIALIRTNISTLLQDKGNRNINLSRNLDSKLYLFGSTTEFYLEQKFEVQTEFYQNQMELCFSHKIDVAPV